jgi:hypothetical protein
MSDVGTPTAERKALDLIVQASRVDPKLRAAVREVEQWILRLQEDAHSAWQNVDEVEQELGDSAALLAENRRLRDALERIAASHTPWLGPPVLAMQAVAKAALARDSEEET